MRRESLPVHHPHRMTGPGSTCQIGNLPEAFTHLAMIDEAITLDEALNRGGPPAPAQHTMAEPASAPGAMPQARAPGRPPDRRTSGRAGDLRVGGRRRSVLACRTGPAGGERSAASARRHVITWNSSTMAVSCRCGGVGGLRPVERDVRDVLVVVAPCDALRFR